MVCRGQTVSPSVSQDEKRRKRAWSIRGNELGRWSSPGGYSHGTHGNGIRCALEGVLRVLGGSHRANKLIQFHNCVLTVSFASTWSSSLPIFHSRLLSRQRFYHLYYSLYSCDKQFAVSSRENATCRTSSQSRRMNLPFLPLFSFAIVLHSFWNPFKRYS